jgi:hypothetical protein
MVLPLCEVVAPGAVVALLRTPASPSFCFGSCWGILLFRISSVSWSVVFLDADEAVP